jgi:UMF1 family MFS transporter
MTKEKKAIWGWAMYDWANSAFATTVMAGFFPIFFKKYWSYGVDVNMSTAQLGFGNSIASLFVALMAPVIGAIADRGSSRKKFLLFFAYSGVLMTASLFAVQKGEWAWAIFIYAMGIIGIPFYQVWPMKTKLTLYQVLALLWDTSVVGCYSFLMC